MLIQFRRQIVHQIDALAAPGLTNQVPLGDTQGTDNQFLLTSGQHLGGAMRPQTQAQIGTLRTSLGVANLLITEEGSGQHLTQLTLPVPAAVVTQSQSLQLDQLTQGTLKTGFNAWI